MQKTALLALASALLLTACGSGDVGSVSPAPQPAPVTSTLYQGVWGWGIVDQSSGTLLDSGAAVFDREEAFESRTVASGGFSNKAQSQTGAAILGPVRAAGTLDTAFVLNGNTSTPLFAGSDTDGVLGTFEGKATFEGGGATFENGTLAKVVAIVLIQTSTSVPQGAAALSTAKLQARTTAIRAAAQHSSGFTALKLDLDQLKALRNSLR
jgi:hypothetical protein